MGAVDKVSGNMIIGIKVLEGKMKGGIGWKLITLALDCDPWMFYLMFLSREIDIKLCQFYTKIHIYKIVYRNGGFKVKTDHIQQIRNQSENKDIFLEEANCFLQSLFYNCYFYF